ncbi:ComF family protein [Marinoscillum sp.]|uniref:ComF family protein n=1 Tax=Marinoscillum sp. TaxID=2024838 RepID=UPI003BACEF7E
MKKFVFEPKVQKAAAYLFFNKGGVAQKIIHEIKYKNQPEFGVLIGEWYGHDLSKTNWPIDLIIPVPLHKSKLARRGFNQSERIGEGISRSTGWPLVSDIAIRTRHTVSQTRKSKVQRWKNMQSVYKLKRTGAVTGKNVAIVDDVLTTGATIGELVSLLVESGAAGVYIITLAAGK